MIKNEVNVMKPLLEKEIEVEITMKNGKPDSIVRKTTNKFSTKRIVNTNLVVLNFTSYIVNYKPNDDNHFGFVFSAYDPIYKTGIVYINNSYEVLEKVLVLNNLSDTMLWFDKVNNMVLTAISKNTFDININKRNRMNSINLKLGNFKFTRRTKASNKNNYDYFIKPSDILCRQDYYKVDNFNIFFINEDSIMDLKEFYTNYFLHDRIKGDWTPKEFPNILKSAEMVNLVCNRYLCRDSRLVNEFLNFGKVIKTTTMNDILNKELNGYIQSL